MVPSAKAVLLRSNSHTLSVCDAVRAAELGGSVVNTHTAVVLGVASESC